MNAVRGTVPRCAAAESRDRSKGSKGIRNPVGFSIPRSECGFRGNRMKLGPRRRVGLLPMLRHLVLAAIPALPDRTRRQGCARPPCFDPRGSWDRPGMFRQPVLMEKREQVAGRLSSRSRTSMFAKAPPARAPWHAAQEAKQNQGTHPFRRRLPFRSRLHDRPSSSQPSRTDELRRWSRAYWSLSVAIEREVYEEFSFCKSCNAERERCQSPTSGLWHAADASNKSLEARDAGHHTDGSIAEEFVGPGTLPSALAVDT